MGVYHIMYMIVSVNFPLCFNAVGCVTVRASGLQKKTVPVINKVFFKNRWRKKEKLTENRVMQFHVENYGIIKRKGGGGLFQYDTCSSVRLLGIN